MREKGRGQRSVGMGIGWWECESGSEESVGRGHRKTGCQSARTLDIGRKSAERKG